MGDPVSNVTNILTFWLDGGISVNRDIESYPEIELLFDKEKESYLTGCRITLQDSTEEKIRLANAKVEVLADYLGLLTGLPVHFIGPSITKFQDGKYVGTRSNSVAFNVVKSTIVPLKLSHVFSLQNDPVLAQRLAHATAGRKALFDNDFQGAIREYYLALENSGNPEEAKYRSLRHAVSHERLNNERTIRDLEVLFGIKIPKGGYLNATDPAIRQLLEIHARKLKEVVETYLKSELSKA